MPIRKVFHLLENSGSSQTFDGYPACGALKSDTADVCIRHGIPICSRCARDARRRIIPAGIGFRASFLTT